MTVRMHLNGGPNPDGIIAIHGDSDTFEVIRQANGMPPAFTPGDSVMTVPVQHGRYKVRRSASGHRVLFCLDGTVEADWQGWDTIEP